MSSNETAVNRQRRAIPLAGNKTFNTKRADSRRQRKEGRRIKIQLRGENMISKQQLARKEQQLTF